MMDQLSVSKEQITKNLSNHEIMCPCCNSVFYETQFTEKLQTLRDLMGIPFRYSKGGFYRCSMYNESLYNSRKKPVNTTSQHLKGRACDIRTKGWSHADIRRIISLALTMGFSVGFYSAHIHLDLRIGEPVFYHGRY